MTRIEYGIVGGLVAMLVLSMGALAITSDRWMRLERLQVLDAQHGAAIPIAYDREYFREFDGNWAVYVWALDKGEWSAFCTAQGSWPYTPSRPNPARTLAWLTTNDPRCMNLTPGDYVVDVAVTANPGSILERTARIRSNVFTVRQ